MKFSSFLLSLLVFTTGISLRAQTSTVSVTINPNPLRFGSPATISATVAPSTATGKVTFYEGSRVLGIASVTNGSATLTSLQLTPDTSTVSARYDGDLNDSPSVSAPVTVTVNAVAGDGFPQLTAYSAGKIPNAVATGDFNGDGKLDLAVTSGEGPAVYVLLGNGNGTFQTPVPYAAGALPVAVIAADLNGDGKPDLIVANDFYGATMTSASIDVLLGNGDGTFQAPVVYTTPNSPLALIAGDFNLDGNVDIAVANASYSDVSIFLGAGNGMLTLGSDIATGPTTGAVGIAAGDFNRDGIPDLAIAETNLVIAIGNGDGTFTIGQSLPAGNDLNDVQTGDFNGDGMLDLAVADYGGSTVSVVLGNGNGTFQPAVAYAVQSAPSSVLITDYNGDGKPDIVAANNFSGGPGSVSLLAGNGTGAFAPAVNFGAGVGPFRMAQGDFNGDGVVDLAVDDLGDFNTNPGGISILLGGCFTVSPVGPLFYDNTGTNGQPITFTLTAQSPACTWTATATIPGVTFTPSSGTGNAVVSATIAPNSSSADLNGSISLAGSTISVFEAFTTQQFTDVPPSAYYFDAVNLLKTLNITSGCTSTMYCPTADITRAQMAVFIVRSVYGSDDFPVQLATPYFSDVTPETFGYMWIQKMYELGITTGCAPGLFCPAQNISRDQMAIFIIRARYGAKTAFTYNPAPYFLDVPTNGFAFQWIQRMKQDNVTSGCAPGYYCPASVVTRGDMSLFVDRGSFNLELPATEPIISSVTPATLAPGSSNLFTVTGVNTFFTQSLPVVVSTGGMTASGVTVLSDTEFTVTLTADPSALIQPEPMYVQSSVEAVKPNAISVQ